MSTSVKQPKYNRLHMQYKYKSIGCNRLERPSVELEAVEVMHAQAIEAARTRDEAQLPTSEGPSARIDTKATQKWKTYSMTISSHTLSRYQSVVIATLLTADRVKIARESRCCGISSLEAEISRLDVAYALHQLGD